MSELMPLQDAILARDPGVIIVRARRGDLDAGIRAALNGGACHRTGPNEWIVICDPAATAANLAAIRAACGDGAVLAIDISHGVTALELAGARGAERLAAYCDLDLGSERLATEGAVRTRFGEIGVVLARLDDRPAYLLIADQSYADYLALLMRHGVAA